MSEVNEKVRIGDIGWIRRYSISYDCRILESWVPELGGGAQILVESRDPEDAKLNGRYFYSWVLLEDWKGYT